MDSKERFSTRVETYVQYRPSYPADAVEYLFDMLGMPRAGVIADIGAGTGIFSKLLLERGAAVWAVEPNRDMREAAVASFGDASGFRAYPGSAEDTGLPSGSADGIVCAQAFHWFDRNAARTEFRRILKPDAPVALIWNSRLTSGTPFREGYDRLLHTYCTGYEQVGHKNLTLETLRPFFRDGGPAVARFPFRQEFDFEGLKGRLMSSSYTPLPGSPNHEPLMRELKELFGRCEIGGRVFFDYETEVYGGRV